MAAPLDEQRLIDDLVALKQLFYHGGINRFEAEFIESIRKRVYKFEKALTPKQKETAIKIRLDLGSLKASGRRPRD